MFSTTKNTKRHENDTFSSVSHYSLAESTQAATIFLQHKENQPKNAKALRRKDVERGERRVNDGQVPVVFKG